MEKQGFDVSELLTTAKESGFTSAGRLRWYPVLPKQQIRGKATEDRWEDVSQIARVNSKDDPGIGKVGDIVTVLLRSQRVKESDIFLLLPFIYFISLAIPSFDACWTTVDHVLRGRERYMYPAMTEHCTRLAAFRELLRFTYPKTYAVLVSIDAVADKFLNRIFIGFFYDLLSKQIAMNILDIYMICGEEALYRFGVALIQMFKKEIKSNIFKTAKEFWDFVKKSSHSMDFRKLSAAAFEDDRLALLRIVSPKISRSSLEVHKSKYSGAMEGRMSNPEDYDEMHSSVSLAAASCTWLDDALKKQSAILNSKQAVTLQVFLSEVGLLPSAFRLMYSSLSDGWSMKKMYAKAAAAAAVGLGGPCLLLMRSKKCKAVIGAYLSCGIVPPTDEKTTHGDPTCFVFRLGRRPSRYISSLNSECDVRCYGHGDYGDDDRSLVLSALMSGFLSKLNRITESVKQSAKSASMPGETAAPAPPDTYKDQQFVRFEHGSIFIGTSYPKDQLHLGNEPMPTHALKITDGLRSVISQAGETYNNPALIPEESETSPFAVELFELYCSDKIVALPSSDKVGGSGLQGLGSGLDDTAARLEATSSQLNRRTGKENDRKICGEGSPSSDIVLHSSSKQSNASEGGTVGQESRVSNEALRELIGHSRELVPSSSGAGTSRHTSGERLGSDVGSTPPGSEMSGVTQHGKDGNDVKEKLSRSEEDTLFQEYTGVKHMLSQLDGLKHRLNSTNNVDRVKKVRQRVERIEILSATLGTVKDRLKSFLSMVRNTKKAIISSTGQSNPASIASALSSSLIASPQLSTSKGVGGGNRSLSSHGDQEGTLYKTTVTLSPSMRDELRVLLVDNRSKSAEKQKNVLLSRATRKKFLDECEFSSDEGGDDDDEGDTETVVAAKLETDYESIVAAALEMLNTYSKIIKFEEMHVQRAGHGEADVIYGDMPRARAKKFKSPFGENLSKVASMMLRDVASSQSLLTDAKTVNSSTAAEAVVAAAKSRSSVPRSRVDDENDAASRASGSSQSTMSGAQGSAVGSAVGSATGSRVSSLASSAATPKRGGGGSGGGGGGGRERVRSAGVHRATTAAAATASDGSCDGSGWAAARGGSEVTSSESSSTNHSVHSDAEYADILFA